MPELVLGPLLRYIGETEATVWVEADAACEVEVLGHRARTFCVAGHHFALVVIEGLEPGVVIPYEVALDGRRVWPQDGSPYPASVIRTLGGPESLRLLFGSCRVSAPHEPPYTLRKDDDPRGRGPDALVAVVDRMRHRPPEQWPTALLMLGDQIYADEVSPGTLRFMEARRDVTKPPGAQVGDFDEYHHLYLDSWGDPPLRWLLSTVPTAMIFDDHDVHDDWNISRVWVERMRREQWWGQHMRDALSSYWVYQHLGNMAPAQLDRDDLWPRVRAADDAGPLLREFAHRADLTTDAARWSFCRDLGRTRVLVIDSRAGRVLDPDRRDMLDEDEWHWLEEHARGDFDHLVLATTMPYLLAPAMHDLEAWSDAVSEGAWGRRLERLGEYVRESLDLEHWAAFGRGFARLTRLIEEVGAGRWGPAPATITVLAGDVHHSYLAEMAFPRGAGVRSAVHQVVGSPFRNELARHEQRAIRFALSRPGQAMGRALARSAGVRRPRVRWRFAERRVWFDNVVGSLEIEGRAMTARLDTAVHDPERCERRLERALERRLS